jgi:hypothetical protein
MKWPCPLLTVQAKILELVIFVRLVVVFRTDWRARSVRAAQPCETRLELRHALLKNVPRGTTSSQDGLRWKPRGERTGRRRRRR